METIIHTESEIKHNHFFPLSEPLTTELPQELAELNKKCADRNYQINSDDLTILELALDKMFGNEDSSNAKYREGRQKWKSYLSGQNSNEAKISLIKTMIGAVSCFSCEEGNKEASEASKKIEERKDTFKLAFFREEDIKDCPGGMVSRIDSLSRTDNIESAVFENILVRHGQKISHIGAQVHFEAFVNKFILGKDSSDNFAISPADYDILSYQDWQDIIEDSLTAQHTIVATIENAVENYVAESKAKGSKIDPSEAKETALKKLEKLIPDISSLNGYLESVTSTILAEKDEDFCKYYVDSFCDETVPTKEYLIKMFREELPYQISEDLLELLTMATIITFHHDKGQQACKVPVYQYFSNLYKKNKEKPETFQTEARLNHFIEHCQSAENIIEAKEDLENPLLTVLVNPSQESQELFDIGLREIDESQKIIYIHQASEYIKFNLDKPNLPNDYKDILSNIHTDDAVQFNMGNGKTGSIRLRQYGKVQMNFPEQSYEGYFVNGKIHGQGVLKYANRNIYEGGWKDGKKHGVGVLKYANGHSYRGEWQNGKIPAQLCPLPTTIEVKPGSVLTYLPAANPRR